jgi:hypothetical protein
VEKRLNELPTALLADSFGQGRRIVIGKAVAEGFLGGVKQILAIEEGDGAFDQRFRGDGRRHDAA